MIWDKGANTLLLTGTEMRQISGISEKNAVNTALLELMHRRPDQILTVDWLARVWRAAHPTVDVTAHGDHVKWTGLRQASNTTRKLAISSLVYDRNKYAFAGTSSTGHEKGYPWRHHLP